MGVLNMHPLLNICDKSNNMECVLEHSTPLIFFFHFLLFLSSVCIPIFRQAPAMELALTATTPLPG